MAESNKIPKIDPAEVEVLIEKFEQNKLGEQEKRMIVGLLRTLLQVVGLLHEKKITIMRLKEMVFGRRSEKRRRGERGKDETKNEAGGDSEDGAKEESPKSERSEKREKFETAEVSKRGHGRNPVSAYVGAKKVHCLHRELSSGGDCPDRNCRGRVYSVKRPHQFIQFVGQPAITATLYELEVMRCNGCGREYEAELPAGVSAKKYDETADAAMAINRHGMGVPYYRSAGMEEACGIPLAESVQAERCEAVAESLLPIYQEMRREAAQGKVFYGDDTPVKILELIKENKGKAKGERVGMQTTAIVVETAQGARIALYVNGRKHTGENLGELYELRRGELGPPVQMGDGLPANWKSGKQAIQCQCLIHARRKFVEIESSYRVECGYMLERIGEIYEHEAETKGMSDLERLEYHQKQSGPIMEELKEWMDEQIREKKVEPNSSLGKAIAYFQNNYEGLSAFLRYSGAPIDNNVAVRSVLPK
jgi:transposase